MAYGKDTQRSAKDRQRLARHRSYMYWRQASAEGLRMFIDLLTTDGNAVMFGRTRDGGALSLLVLSGDDKLREYISSPGDLCSVLGDTLDELGYTEEANQFVQLWASTEPAEEGSQASPVPIHQGKGKRPVESNSGVPETD